MHPAADAARVKLTAMHQTRLAQDVFFILETEQYMYI